MPGRAADLDELDERIVAALVEDARASYADIGARVGLSASAVKRRVDRLRATGAITGFTVTVDPAALGWTTEAYVELFFRGRTPLSSIGAALSKYPEVTGASRSPGRPMRCCTSGRPTCSISSGWWNRLSRNRSSSALAA